MGKIGRSLGGILGKALGGVGGKYLKQYTGIGEDEGRQKGEELGADLGEKYLPFKTGGRVKKNGKIIAHKGEFILPRGVKPTTHQIKMVRKRGGFKKKKPIRG